MYIGLTHDRAYITVQPSAVENNDTAALIALWNVTDATSPDQAIGAILALAADQYLPAPLTVTRLIPRHPTNDERIDAARRILRADYWQDVRNVADNLRDEIKAGNITSRDEADTYLDESVDGHQRVIYTAQAIEGLLYTDNESAYVDETGSPPPSQAFEDNSAWSQLMYYAFRADILDTLSDIDDLLTEAATGCYLCGNAFTPDDEYEIDDAYDGSSAKVKVHTTCPDDDDTAI